MDLTTFTDTLRRLSAEQIRRCAAGLRSDDEPLPDQVARWRAELAIDCLVHRRCTRAAAQQPSGAAQAAIRVVTDAARQQGIALPDGDVTRVARTAGQIARGLALGGLGADLVRPLLTHFEAALDRPAAPPVPTAA
jgi:hypothetical protein